MFQDTTEIGKRTFSSSVAVMIEPDVLIYNGKPQMPKIKVFENWDGALKNELRENIDYKISYWEKKISGGTGSEIKDSEIKDAGTYAVQLMELEITMKPRMALHLQFRNLHCF